MRTLLLLLAKDFRHDLKSPGSLVLFAFLPIVMTGLMATIFGEPQGSTTTPAIRVAVLDEDRGPLADALRFLATRHQAAREVQVQFVRNRDRGLRLLEEGEASVLVVLPAKMSENFVSGRPSTIELYENPAEQYLPKILHEQVSMLADSLSESADGLRDSWRNAWNVLHLLSSPTKATVLQAGWQWLQRLHQEPQGASSSIELETVSAAEYRLQVELPSRDSRTNKRTRGSGTTREGHPQPPHHQLRNP